ncbi:MAG: Nitrogen assimilation regulatory protein [Deltaproteobacteria bacterium ADurb.Bin510]|nr:MAG: Nitrogen assimilation regulatory protein [Deltaproteobacteria bacterium ADurb.Bin510]
MRIKHAAIVDDDNEVLDLIEQILTEEGLTVSRYNRGEALLEDLTRHDFDVIISDLMLEGMSGLDLLDKLHEWGHDIPFVLITGYASLDSAIQAVNRGAFYYIKKPFNIDEIRFIIAKLEQQAGILAEIRKLKEEVGQLKVRLEPPEELVDVPRQPGKASPYENYDTSKVLAIIEHLDQMKAEGQISEKEFGEYRGKLLKRII